MGGKKIRSGSAFEWTAAREKAAIALANGYNQRQAAEVAGVVDRTIRTWLAEPEFIEEIDRLSLMTDIAARAERLRIAKRMIREIQEQAEQAETLPTSKDLLDWLRYAQSETDGASIGLAAFIAQFTTTEE